MQSWKIQINTLLRSFKSFPNQLRILYKCWKLYKFTFLRSFKSFPNQLRILYKYKKFTLLKTFQKTMLTLVCFILAKKTAKVMDGRFPSTWDLQKSAESSPNMFLWIRYATVVRATPSELWDRSILMRSLSEFGHNP